MSFCSNSSSGSERYKNSHGSLPDVYLVSRVLRRSIDLAPLAVKICAAVHPAGVESPFSRARAQTEPGAGICGSLTRSRRTMFFRTLRKQSTFSNRTDLLSARRKPSTRLTACRLAGLALCFTTCGTSFRQTLFNDVGPGRRAYKPPRTSTFRQVLLLNNDL